MTHVHMTVTMIEVVVGVPIAPQAPVLGLGALRSSQAAAWEEDRLTAAVGGIWVPTTEVHSRGTRETAAVGGGAPA